MTTTPGQRAAETILDLIDGTLADDMSPDAMRWTPEPPSAAVAPRRTQGTPVVPLLRIWSSDEDARQAVAQTLAELRRAIAAWFEAVAPAVREMCQALAAAYAVHAPDEADQEPTDPMQRALWLRRNRNTGPALRQRAPRRIDPRRGR
jgi:hypothetical protein